jgi:RIO kinase 1
MMLKRDVNNMRSYFGRFAPALLSTRFADEIWSLYEKGELTPQTVLTGHFADRPGRADVRGIIEEIDAVKDEHAARLRQLASRE